MQELSEIPEATREPALSRLRLLEPHLEHGEPLLTVAQEAGVPVRTAGRWVALYRKHGLGGLARKARTDRGGHRVVLPDMRQELLQTDTPPEIVQQRKPSRKVLERLEQIGVTSRNGSLRTLTISGC